MNIKLSFRFSRSSVLGMNSHTLLYTRTAMRSCRTWKRAFYFWSPGGVRGRHVAAQPRPPPPPLLLLLLLCKNIYYVVAKATYIRLLHGKIGFLVFFRP